MKELKQIPQSQVRRHGAPSADAHRVRARWSIGLFLSIPALLTLVGCGGAHPDAAAQPELRVSDKVRARLRPGDLSYANVPDESTLPIPPDGWYAVELKGDTIKVFRDEYGAPHIFAPSPEAAFRAQGYVIAQDRVLQMMKSRAAVRGRRALLEGRGRLGNDRDVLTHSYTDEELQGMIDALQPDLRRYFCAYMEGVNQYLADVLNLEPASPLDLVAGAVFYMTHYGGWGGDQLEFYKILEVARFLKGDEFTGAVLNDCLPRDVPCAPTTDHSHTRVEGLTVASPTPERFQSDPSVMVAILEQQEKLKAIDNRDGLITSWGSFCWVASGKRTVTGKPMLFTGPYVRFDTPARAALVHLVAPGLNVTGMCFHGTPGVQVGHNDHVAWGSTTGLLTVKDVFAEELNPKNKYQYRHNGEWKDMERRTEWIPVREADGSVTVEPHEVCRTVHGAVVAWYEVSNRAYTVCSPWPRLELQSFMSFVELNFAKNFDDVEKALRKIATAHNILAADTEGNIGYWLTGRIPKRHPGVDPRLPVPGTGEYDWRGVTVATDLVRSINPQEGWFASSNNKPSTATPDWFPEGTWAVKIFEMMAANDCMTMDDITAINRANAEHSFLATYMKPLLLEVLEARKAGRPDVAAAIRLLEEWPDKDVPDEPAALLFNEWVKELLVELLSPDFGGMVKRDSSMENLKLFFTLAYRVLLPDKAGIELQGDYLHGRDRHDVAFAAFETVFAELKEAHGEDMSQWPFDNGETEFGELGSLPRRNAGTYWLAAELGDTIRAKDLLVPGQSGLQASPHFGDQFELFRDWQYKEMRFLPEDFEPPPDWDLPVLSE
jgi:penicillin G amidase